MFIYFLCHKWSVAIVLENAGKDILNKAQLSVECHLHVWIQFFSNSAVLWENVWLTPGFDGSLLKGDAEDGRKCLVI